MGPEILPVLPRSIANPSKTYDTLPKQNNFVFEKYEHGYSSKTFSGSSSASASTASTSSSSYYAVAKGKNVGIYTNW